MSELRDTEPEWSARGLRVVAVSCDPMFALRAYAEAERLPFDLLTDWWPHGRIAQAYGVFDEELGCARRGTFVIDPAGVIVTAAVTAIGERRDLQSLLAG